MIYFLKSQSQKNKEIITGRMEIVTVGNHDSGEEVEALSSDTLGIC